MSGRPSDELCAGYEALRAAATGSMAVDTPRGLALLLAQGLPTWMRALGPRPTGGPIGPAGDQRVVPGVGAEVVRLLTEMALGCRTRLATS